MVKDRLYTWWKRKPGHLRRPLVFILGVLMVSAAPFVGIIPGPGGIILFVTGIAILASEFDWAEALKVFFLKTVPKEIENRWRPTPKWSLTFDVTAGLLLIGAGIAIYYEFWSIVASLGIGGFCLFVFNNNRLDRLKKKLKR